MDNGKIYTIDIKGGGYTVQGEKINKIQLGRILSVITSDDSNPTSAYSPSLPVSKIPTKRRTKSNFPSPILVRKELESLNFDPISPLYGNYWTVNKTKSDKIMWILAFANENKIESVYQKEISFIAEKLGDNIPPKSISALLESHKNSGRIVPSVSEGNKTIRILKPGLDYVKGLSSKAGK